MERRMTGQRVWPGRDVRILREGPDGLELEGATRLRPGQCVDIVSPGSTTGDATVRQAVVWSWTLIRTGSSGHIFRGFCRWT